MTAVSIRALNHPRFSALLYLIMTAALLLRSVATSAAIVEQQQLNFGIIAIPDNSITSSLTIPYTGLTPSISGNIVFLAPGNPGIYRLQSFPPDTALIISVTGSNLIYMSNHPTAEPLQMNAFSYPALTTDSLGEAVIELGATVSTTGSGAPYLDGPYAGDISITINW
jgi:hypothetical protein